MIISSLVTSSGGKKMRQDVLLRRFGIACAAVLLVGLMAVAAFAQDQPENGSAALFTRSSATVVLTNTGMSISPEVPGPGPVSFTIENRSDQARGVVISGNDRVGDPIMAYSPRIRPGASTKMNFWLYEGTNYTFKDYTARQVVGRESQFKSTYSTQIMTTNPFPIGRGPQYPLQTGQITITNSGVEVTPAQTNLGPVVFTVTNNSDHARGVVISGEDRANTPIYRYSRVLRPGASAKMNFWLYEGKTYKIQDYTRRVTSRGVPAYDTAFTTQLTVNPEPSIGPLGAGPSAPKKPSQ
jgi:hypothetical protein